jgi:hypothetical protein
MIGRTARQQSFIRAPSQVFMVYGGELDSKPQPTRLSADPYFSLVVIQLRREVRVNELHTHTQTVHAYIVAVSCISLSSEG